MAEKRRADEAGGASDRASGRVTLRHLAAELDLSPTTVSLVLNRSPAAASIPEETQQRVFAGAEKLGYRPDFVARSLRSRRSFSVGVLVPEINEGYASEILSGVEARLLAEGYFYLVASHRTRKDLLREYMLLLQDRLIEGYILVNTPLIEAPPLPAVAIAGHMPLDGVTNVVIDNDRAALLALSLLADLGHKRIAFLKGHPNSADTEPRWRANVAAAAALGLEVRPERTLQLGSDAVERRFTPEEAYEEGHAFGSRLLEVGSPFTALVAFNDVSAIGAMRAFLDAGLRVPEDLSVVGFDDIHGAAYQNPSLTTIRQPLHEMGETAGRILLERLAGGSGSREVVTIEPRLVVRDSTGPAPDGARHAPWPRS